MKKKSLSSLVWIGTAVAGIGAVLAADYLRPPPSASAAPPDTVVVYKSPTCNCCSKWIAQLKKAGFKVEAHNESEMSLVKTRLGVPQELASCHTSTINGYVIEGHVPAANCWPSAPRQRALPCRACRSAHPAWKWVSGWIPTTCCSLPKVSRRPFSAITVLFVLRSNHFRIGAEDAPDLGEIP